VTSAPIDFRSTKIAAHAGPLFLSSHQRDQQGGRFAAAELLLPMPPLDPLVLAEPPLLLPLVLPPEAIPEELPLPVELLPLIPDEPEEPAPEPEEAVFSFGWPVAWSRQWVAAEIEPDPVPDGLLPD
jgi:hypothetical protein